MVSLQLGKTRKTACFVRRGKRAADEPGLKALECTVRFAGPTTDGSDFSRRLFLAIYLAQLPGLNILLIDSHAFGKSTLTKAKRLSRTSVCSSV